MNYKSDRISSVPLMVRLPRGLADRIERIAERTGLSRPQVVRLMIARTNEEDVFPRVLFDAADEIRPMLQPVA